MAKKIKRCLKKGAPKKLKPCEDSDSGPDSDFEIESQKFVSE